MKTVVVTGAAEDVGLAIAFLLNDGLGGFINGVSLPVHCGCTVNASWDGLHLRTRS